jgi:HlyD family secretion protein
MVLAVLVGVIGVWGVQARIAGAVIASGLIQVENNRQVLQHPQGGVVGAILARDGDLVEAGDVVLRLDDTLLRSELAIVTNQLNENRARKGRLTAERDETAEVIFSEMLLEAAQADAEVAALIEGQARLFQARRTSLAQEETQIDKQITQTHDQIDGVQAQLAATEDQSVLMVSERSDAQSLLDRGLTQASRVNALRREEARLLGEIGQFNASVAQLEGAIAGLEIQKLRQRSVRREEAITQLRDLSVQEIELAAREISTRDRLSKMEVRTPVSGVIYGSRVFAVQSVVTPADPMMYVVPQDQPLIVSARIEAIHIDQVYEGQEAALRFVAFDQRTTPEILGIVSRLSADAFTDEVTGISFYQAELLPRPEELAKLEGQTLLPGMPVEAFIKTAERSPLSYLINPLMGYFYRAFRES